jgi:hypothetical protein
VIACTYICACDTAEVCEINETGDESAQPPEECGSCDDISCDNCAEQKEALPAEIGWTSELMIPMFDLCPETDIPQLLLRGVVATDENREDLTHLVTITDDGGFSAYFDQLMSIKSGDFDEDALIDFSSGEYAYAGEVVYAVTDPETDVETTSDPRNVYVTVMLSLRSSTAIPDWVRLNNAVNNISAVGITTVVIHPFGTTLTNTHGTLVANAGADRRLGSTYNLVIQDTDRTDLTPGTIRSATIASTVTLNAQQVPNAARGPGHAIPVQVRSLRMWT